MAVFDFDRTLIDVSSLRLFLEQVTSKAAMVRVALGAALRTAPTPSRAALKRRLVAGVLAGRTVDHVRPVAERFARDLTERHLDESHRLRLREHLDAGDTVVLLSAALDVYLMPAAHLLSIENVICTKVLVDHGRFTGELCNADLYGEGKVEALRRWLDDTERRDVSVVAYGNGWQDRAILRYAAETRRNQRTNS